MIRELRKSGFTLVELMIATVALSIMVLAVGLVLVYGWKGWNSSQEAVAMQREASLAFKVIAKEIRRSSYTNLICTADSIVFAADGVIRTDPASIVRSNKGDLTLTDENGDFILIGAGVTKFEVIPVSSNQSVVVTLEYASENDYDTGSTTATLYPRNGT